MVILLGGWNSYTERLASMASRAETMSSRSRSSISCAERKVLDAYKR
jgi:hypothetical protein